MKRTIESLLSVLNKFVEIKPMFIEDYIQKMWEEIVLTNPRDFTQNIKSPFATSTMKWWKWLTSYVHEQGFKDEAHCHETQWKYIFSEVFKSLSIHYVPGFHGSKLISSTVIRLIYDQYYQTQSESAIKSTVSNNNSNSSHVLTLGFTWPLTTLPLAFKTIIEAYRTFQHNPMPMENQQMIQKQKLAARHFKYLNLQRPFDTLLLIYACLLAQPASYVPYAIDKNRRRQWGQSSWSSCSINRPRFYIGFILTGLQARYPELQTMVPGEAPWSVLGSIFQSNFVKNVIKANFRNSYQFINV